MCSVRTEVKRSFAPYSTSDSSPALNIIHTYRENTVKEGGREGGKERGREREGRQEYVLEC